MNVLHHYDNAELSSLDLIQYMWAKVTSFTFTKTFCFQKQFKYMIYSFTTKTEITSANYHPLC